MKSIFSVGYGSKKREEKILQYLEEDYIVAIILAAVHFEWMLKRTILKLSKSPTKKLRKTLENVFLITSSNNQKILQKVWISEVANEYKNASFGTVLPNFTSIKDKSKFVRGFLVHGNGLTKKSNTKSAINEYLRATQKLREFALKNGHDLDKRLNARLK